MTPLSEARADAVICRSAARALRRGDNPRDVARFIATYCGVVIPIPGAVATTWLSSKGGSVDVAGTITTSGGVTFDVEPGDFVFPILLPRMDPPKRRRRWPWSK